MRHRGAAPAQPRRSIHGSASCSPGCCARCPTAGSDSAGVAVVRRPDVVARQAAAPSRCSTSARPRSVADRVGAELGVEVTSADRRHLSADRGRRLRGAARGRPVGLPGEPWSPASARDLAVLKGVGNPRTLAGAWGLAGGAGLAGRRAHPDGHRVGRHAVAARTRTPSARTSAWCTTGRSPTTPPSAANCRPQECDSTARTTPRSAPGSWRSRLAEGRDVETALQGTVRDLRRLLHAAGLQPRLVRRGPRRDRLQARRHRRDRRLGGDGSEYRALSGLPGVEKAGSGSPNPEVVYAWTTVTTFDLSTTPLREVNSALHAPGRTARSSSTIPQARTTSRSA